MDSPSTTTETKQNYQPTVHWSCITSASSTPRSTSTSTPLAETSSATSLSPCPPAPAFLPILVSQHHAQLLQYNKLIAPGRGGGGLQSPHIQTVLSVPSIQAPPRSRSSSKVSVKDFQNAKQTPAPQSCHGSRGPKSTDKTDRVAMTKGKEQETPAKMSRHADLTHPLPSRPAQRATQQSGNAPAQSSSVPSTPHQHPRNFSSGSREPSPTAAQNHSPRSAYSETNGNVPSLRPLPARFNPCPFENHAFVAGRRRMPYNIGDERLERVDLDKVKSKLSQDGERKLSTDMRELYDRLMPTPEVEENRQKMVQKLERIFNEHWPGHDIRVHLFGSSGNFLCSDDSDVDICITTTCKEMESVCIIAALLNKRGMEKVSCVSTAKVPIVKIWDPELNLACDMNVNNTAALENTRMVRTYVQIDTRVRPLAMVIKYWTRRRILNDAAYGATLSSYTWICMIIVFLQLRDPPILPALHQRPHQKLPTVDGHKTEFADDLEKLRGFGDQNKSTLGELLFQFFRFYAHEFDYDKMALSVRLGKMITKTEKGWHLAQNNRLCVEEPWSTYRNLGNTADDTSFRGLHLELRRAFDLIAESKLEECCEEYVFPKDEPTEQKVWQKPAPRPAIIRSSSQQHSSRGARNGNYRGTRQNLRNGNSSRRASSSQAYENNAAAFPQPGMLPVTMTPQEAQWYQQQQHSHYPYQQDVFGTLGQLSALHIQEHNLRIQMYAQSQMTAQQVAIAHAQRMQGAATQATDRSRTNSFDQPPLTAPIKNDWYVYGMQLQPSLYTPQAGFTTYPNSPSATSAAPEFRRSLHRSAVTSESGNSSGSGTLRSQSQPASRSSANVQPVPGYPASHHHAMKATPTFVTRQVNGAPSRGFVPCESNDLEFDEGPNRAISDSPPDEDGAGYLGYYVTDNSSPAHKSSNGVQSFGNMGHNSLARRRLSTEGPQSILDRRLQRTSRSPSPLGHTRVLSNGTSSAPLTSVPFHTGNGRLTKENSPLVVNGSASTPSSMVASSRQSSAVEPRTSDDAGFNNPLHISQGQAIGTVVPESLNIRPPPPLPSETSPLFVDRPIVVNGSSYSPAVAQNSPNLQSFGQRIAAGHLSNGTQYATGAGDGTNSRAGLPDQGRPRNMPRHYQNGIAPLDLAVADPAPPEMQHLSPVYEMRTPSPTVLRRFEAPVNYGVPLTPNAANDSKSDKAARPHQRPSVAGNGANGGTKEGHSGVSSSSRVHTGTASRENGHVRAAKSENDNSGSWHKTKARKKQTESKNATNGNLQSEQLPKNESERKGG